jgi:hypothetical protein
MSGVFTQSGVLVEGCEMTDHLELSFRGQREKSFQRKVRCALTEPLRVAGSVRGNHLRCKYGRTIKAR